MSVRSGEPPRWVHTMRPAWFRRLVLPAYHSDWTEAEQFMFDDPNQRRRINELMNELSRKGFERPVVLERDHWWSPRAQVSDGVHRSVAAMRLGLPIPVRFGHDSSGEYDHSDVYRITANSLPDSEFDLVDAAMTLASFRSASGAWIQTDSASGPVEGPVDIYLPRHPEFRGMIAAELQDRLSTAGVDAVVRFLENRPDTGE